MGMPSRLVTMSASVRTSTPSAGKSNVTRASDGRVAGDVVVVCAGKARASSMQRPSVKTTRRTGGILHCPSSTLPKIYGAADGLFRCRGCGWSDIQPEWHKPVATGDSHLHVKPHVTGFWSIEKKRQCRPAALVGLIRLGIGRVNVNDGLVVLAESNEMAERSHHRLKPEERLPVGTRHGQMAKNRFPRANLLLFVVEV